MLTVVGRDQTGIVAEVSRALFSAGAQLGDASMLRLGSNFTIMLMVEIDSSGEGVQDLLDPVARRFDLQVHVLPIEPGLHQRREPDVLVKVHGADRPGIIAQVVGALAEAGLNITDLESRVGGTPEQPIYVMTIEGQAGQGVAALQAALAEAGEGVEAQLEQLETLYG